MNMKELMAPLPITTLDLANSAALAAGTGAQSNNDQANSSVDAGQVVPDVREDAAPNSVDNNQTSSDSGGTMLHPDGLTMSQDNMSSDEVHKNLTCKDGHCLGTGKKLDNGDSMNHDSNKTDGATQ